jgi:hypothetical protein
LFRAEPDADLKIDFSTDTEKVADKKTGTLLKTSRDFAPPVAQRISFFHSPNACREPAIDPPISIRDSLPPLHFPCLKPKAEGAGNADCPLPLFSQHAGTIAIHFYLHCDTFAFTLPFIFICIAGMLADIRIHIAIHFYFRGHWVSAPAPFIFIFRTAGKNWMLIHILFLPNSPQIVSKIYSIFFHFSMSFIYYVERPPMLAPYIGSIVKLLPVAWEKKSGHRT